MNEADVLIITTSTGEKLTLRGRRAQALAVLVVALIRRPHLEDAEVWDAGVHVSPGKTVPRFGDSDLPTHFKESA